MRTRHQLEVDALEKERTELIAKCAFAMDVASSLAAVACHSGHAEAFACALDHAAATAPDRRRQHAANVAARMVRKGAAEAAATVAEA